MFAIVESGGQKYLYNPIISDLAKIIGAANIALCFEEKTAATPEESKVWRDTIMRDKSPVFFPIKG